MKVVEREPVQEDVRGAVRSAAGDLALGRRPGREEALEAAEG